jgi:hypothetical protein
MHVEIVKQPMRTVCDRQKGSEAPFKGVSESTASGRISGESWPRIAQGEQVRRGQSARRKHPLRASIESLRRKHSLRVSIKSIC